MKRTSRFAPLVFLVCLMPFIQGGSCLDIIKPITGTIQESVDKVTQTINQSVSTLNGTLSQAVTTLGDQSSAWQGTVTNLESNLANHVSGLERQVAQDISNLESQIARDATELEKQIAQDAMNLERQLVADVKDIINQVSYIAKDGAQFGQESFNCQTDIFNKHAKVAVQNALNKLLNKQKYQGKTDRPIVPYEPIVCSANPNGINVAAWTPDTYLALSGTDLNIFETQKPSIVVLRADNSEITVPNVGNRVTNYRFQINVAAMIAANQLKDAIQLQVRWNGQRVNQNEIPVVACGGNGQPCCRGRSPVCDSGTCANNICGVCGGLGQPCCNGNACSAGACVNSICTACGGNGQPCCGGSTCNSGSRCSANICNPCGGVGQICCNGNICSGSQCVNNICTICGAIGQACCNGACTSGQCSNNVCSPCGSIGQPCCNGSGCTSGTCMGNVCTACGGINQPCCAGSTCNSGRCLNNVCSPCGGINQPCCINARCNSGQCLNNTCTVVLPACQWTADFSEEGTAQQHCPSGFAVKGVKCLGSDCDNMALYCCPYSDRADTSASKSWTPYFSEEGSGSPFPPGSSSSQLSGARCSGSNCDNISLELLRTPRLRFDGQCIQSRWFSEESPNNYICPDGQWVGGMACRGDHCDDVSLYCCRGTPIF
jgi:hypothetical protein